MADSASVEESAMLRNRVTDQPREVDVVLTQRVGGYDVTVSIEARASDRKATVEWVERMIGKHQDLPTSSLVLISESGFTGAARELATTKGVTTVAPADLDGDDDSLKAIRDLDAVWGKVSSMTPVDLNLYVRLPDGSGAMFPCGPALDLFLEDGTWVGRTGDLARAVLGASQRALITKLDIGNAEDGETRTFTMCVDGPFEVKLAGAPSGLNVCARYEETDPFEFHVIGRVDIEVQMTVRVGEIPIDAKSFDGVAVAFGQGSIGDEEAQIIISEGPNGSKSGTFRMRDADGNTLEGAALDFEEGV
jgi:hypothetical protein